MRRRDVLHLLGAATLLRPSLAAARTTERVRRIGWVVLSYGWGWPQVADHLKPLGWTWGNNIQGALTALQANTFPSDLSQIARDIIATRPDLIVTHGTPATLAILEQTHTLPVLFFDIADPVGNGIVSNLSRPSGNVTGFMSYEPSLAGKWMQMLREIVPQVRRVAIIFDPETASNGSSPFVQEFQATAASLAIEPILAATQDAAQIQPVVAALASEPGGALLVFPDQFTLVHYALIAALANRHRVPAIFGFLSAPASGGLIAYGPNPEGVWRALAGYIDRILRGTPLRDLPVQGPASYSLIVNLRTARALDLTIPSSILVAVDEVIE